jgi:PiT family inorganic phosphate transporter
LVFFREFHWRISSSKKALAALKEKELAKAGSKKRTHRKLVRRSHFLTIIAAWIITVPAAALLSGLLFLAFNNLP